MSPYRSDDVRISKTLSWLLRHAAIKEGLHINCEGFIKVTDILSHYKLVGKCTVSDLLRIVSQDSKKRYTVKQGTDNQWWIRANQGHSIAIIDLELQPIQLTPNLYIEHPQAIHGTYYKHWPSIKTNGLSCMSRNHIHLAKGLPHDKNVTSGIRSTCEIYIYINLKKALDDNLQFFVSANDVILCPGDSSGYLKPKYFEKVIDAKTGNSL